MIDEKIKIQYKCNVCNSDKHVWHEVYYEEFSKLKKAERSYISWCNKVKTYVLANSVV